MCPARAAPACPYGKASPAAKTTSEKSVVQTGGYSAVAAFPRPTWQDYAGPEPASLDSPAMAQHSPSAPSGQYGQMHKHSAAVSVPRSSETKTPPCTKPHPPTRDNRSYIPYRPNTSQAIL